MTMREMAEEYREAAWRLKGRIKDLEAQAEECHSLEAGVAVEERIRALRAIWRETRDLAVLLERYYERGYRRNGKYTL